MTLNGRNGRRASSGRGADELSPLDKRIIEHLQEDGRRPFTQIAAALGVSEAAVRARTNRLVERGILQIVGVADPAGSGSSRGDHRVRCHPDKLVEVSEKIANARGRLRRDHGGPYDVLIETVSEDNEGLLRFLAEKLRRIDGCGIPRRSRTCGSSSRPTSGDAVGRAWRRCGPARVNR